jgi:hypothetical protein
MANLALVSFQLKGGKYYMSLDGENFLSLGSVTMSVSTIYPPSDYMIQQQYPNYGINYGKSDDEITDLNSIFNSHSGSGLTLGVGDEVVFTVLASVNIPTIETLWFKIYNYKYFINVIDDIGTYLSIGDILFSWGSATRALPPTNAMIQSLPAYSNYYLANGYVEEQLQNTAFYNNSGIFSSNVAFSVHAFISESTPSIDTSILTLGIATTGEVGLASALDAGTVETTDAALPSGSAAFTLVNGNYYMSLDGENFSYLGPVSTSSNLIYPPSDYTIQQVFPGYGINYGLDDDAITLLNSYFTNHSGTDAKGDSTPFYVAVTTDTPTMTSVWFKIENHKYYVSQVEDCCFAEIYDVEITGDIFGAYPPTNSNIQTAVLFSNYSWSDGFVDTAARTQAYRDHSGSMSNGDGIAFSLYMYAGVPSASETIIVVDGSAPPSGKASFMLALGCYYMSLDGINFQSLGEIPVIYNALYAPSDYMIQQKFSNYGINYGLSQDELNDLDADFNAHQGKDFAGDGVVFTIDVTENMPEIISVWFKMSNYQYFISLYENSNFISLGEAIPTYLASLWNEPVTDSIIQSSEEFYNYFLATGYLENKLQINGFSDNSGIVAMGNNTAFSLHVYKDDSMTTDPITIAAPNANQLAFIMQNGNYYVREASSETIYSLGKVLEIDGKSVPPSDYLIQQVLPGYGINYGLSDTELTALNTTFNNATGSFNVSVNTSVPTIIPAWFKVENYKYYMSLDPAYGYTQIGSYTILDGVQPPTNTMIQTGFSKYSFAQGKMESNEQTTYFSANAGAASSGNGLPFTLNLYQGDPQTTAAVIASVSNGSFPSSGNASFFIDKGDYYMSLDGATFTNIGPATSSGNLVYPPSDYLIQKAFANYGINYGLSDVELTALNSTFNTHSGTSAMGDTDVFEVAVNTSVPTVVYGWFKIKDFMYYASATQNDNNFIEIGNATPSFVGSAVNSPVSNLKLQSGLYNYYLAMGYIEESLQEQMFSDHSGIDAVGDGYKFSVRMYDGSMSSYLESFVLAG